MLFLLFCEWVGLVYTIIRNSKKEKLYPVSLVKNLSMTTSKNHLPTQRINSNNSVHKTFWTCQRLFGAHPINTHFYVGVVIMIRILGDFQEEIVRPINKQHAYQIPCISSFSFLPQKKH